MKKWFACEFERVRRSINKSFFLCVFKFLKEHIMFVFEMKSLWLFNVFIFYLWFVFEFEKVRKIIKGTNILPVVPAGGGPEVALKIR